MKRMSMDEFARIVREVMESLPLEIRTYLDNVVVDIDDEPDEDFLRAEGFTEDEIARGETLFGLFDPMSVGSPDGVAFLDEPHRLWIFKGPLEDEFPDPKRLRIEIRKTVIHEIAHHFGWTDADLRRFDDNPDPFGERE